MRIEGDTILMDEAGGAGILRRRGAAGDLVRQYVCYSASLGALPLPLLDLAGLTGVQFALLYKLAGLYEVPFSKEAARSVIGALAGGGGAAVMARPVWSLLKAVPVVGLFAGGMTFSIVGGASTYALGMVFIRHFESGGTLLTFDLAAVKDQFARLQEEGRGFVVSVMGLK